MFHRLTASSKPPTKQRQRQQANSRPPKPVNASEFGILGFYPTSIQSPKKHHPKKAPLQLCTSASKEAVAAMASLAANCHGRVLHTCTLSPKPVTALRRSMAAMPGCHVVQSPRGARVAVRANAERATWLPGLDPPPHLDGTLPGDFGFDPLGLGEEPADLKWYVQAELVHCRFAMAGVAGILVTDLIRVSGISNLPVWFEAGATEFDFANTKALFFVQLLLMGFAETKRYMDIINPGSQAKEGTFLGIEAALAGSQPGYPGGPLFNPLGLNKDIENAHEVKLKEIKNGRLAMVAMLGFFVQASVTHVGPIDNLLTHISDPFNKNIIHTLYSP